MPRLKYDHHEAFENPEIFDDEEELPWTDEDEAGLEQYEEDRRRKIAERNEY